MKKQENYRIKNTIILSLLFPISVYSCTGQKKEDAIVDIPNGKQPLTNIKVTKEYDKLGNLVKYDSTYSYYYSNIDKNTNVKDSMMTKFMKRFNERYLFSGEPYFKTLFFQDSLLNYDFYKKDFFIERFRNNTERMNQMFLEILSTKVCL